MSSAISAIASAVIVAGGAVGAAGMSASAAKKASAANAAASGELQGALTDAATTASEEKGALADRLLKQVNASISRYRETSEDVIAGITYTPVAGVLDLGPDGKSALDRMFDIFNSRDAARQSAILGDAEAPLKKALSSFAALAAEDTSGFTAALRSSDAAIAANTRGGAIGQFANLSAQNRFDFQQKGGAMAVNLATLFEGLTTRTADVYQSALQLTDETRREADRKDEVGRTQASAKLGLAQNILTSQIQAQESYTRLKTSAADSLANALAGAAQAGFTGSGGAGLAQLGASNAITGVTSALATGLSQYQANKVQQSTIDLQKAQTAQAIAKTPSAGSGVAATPVTTTK